MNEWAKASTPDLPPGRGLRPVRPRWPGIRRTLFWAHLGAGLVASLFIAVMSVTGILIAFEAELLAYLDRAVRHVEQPAGQAPQTIDVLLTQVRTVHAGFEAGSLSVPSAPDEAYRLSTRGGKALYIDPYTGQATPPPSAGAHHVLHVMEEIHTSLALEGDAEPIGKFILGSANLAFVFLCVSGLVLWFPRKWTRRALRPLLTLIETRSPRARDFNLHAVFGFWSLLVLLVVAGSAVTFSFAWAHELVFALVDEEAPPQRGFAMLLVPPRPVPPPVEGAAPLSLQEVHRRISEAYPGHQSIMFSLASPAAAAAERPLDVHVFMPDLFATRGRVMVQVDPYRGTILSSVAFGDRPPGLRARVWLRFLHTGEAFGLLGKLIATLATAASLVLVSTGVTLTLRRRLGWPAKRAQGGRSIRA